MIQSFLLIPDRIAVSPGCVPTLLTGYSTLDDAGFMSDFGLTKHYGSMVTTYELCKSCLPAVNIRCWKIAVKSIQSPGCWKKNNIAFLMAELIEREI